MISDVTNVSSLSFQQGLTDNEQFTIARKKGLYRISTNETFTSLAKSFGVDNYKILMKLLGRPESKTDLAKGENLNGFKTINGIADKIIEHAKNFINPFILKLF